MDVKEFISSGILEQYVLGLTTPEENVLVQSYSEKFPEVKFEINNISQSLEEYASAYSITPPLDLKEKIFEHIKNISTEKDYQENTGVVPRSTPVYKINSYLKFAAAACFFLLLCSLFFNYTFYNKYKKSSEQIAIVKQELSAQKQVALDMNQEIKVVKDKMALPVVLNGTPHSPQSLAKIFWMKNSGDVYVDPSNLGQLSPDKQYQLWAIVDGKPVNGGMISSKNGDIFHMQKMRSFGKAQAFAITIEKAGGSIAPTMDEMVVIAKI